MKISPLRIVLVLLSTGVCMPAHSQASRHPWSDYIDRQFVRIPGGFLPGPYVPGGQPIDQVGQRILVPPFEASRYPITRDEWENVMPEPFYIPDELRTTWNQCLRCPVTYVHWAYWDEQANLSIRGEIQEFIARLNRFDSRCVYDLPTDRQLWYAIRGDVTGQNQDPYSAGVNDYNLDDYITHWGNSNGQIQQVGLKSVNRFGIELGNVWKLTKDGDLDHPEWGHFMRGGSWADEPSNAKEMIRELNFPGNSGFSVGFNIVRICR